ncbi:MAG: Asp-tRNA(Asn)/Glu-tRNA(Gln) amidotransferase subunit GatC [Deltaproteobacteria bacterium]|nr:Asp-tRNA(Asn)/Glu-tRNA(Gln) amidotransferase subunit GatC [Deltaproteobacteria bacterium]
MPTLTRKEVEEIALLARLHLESDELERMQSELGVILDHFGTIAAIDATGIPAMTHAVAMDHAGPFVSLGVLRPDEPQPSLPVDEALRGTPKRDGDLIVVPAIIPGAKE